MENLTSSSEEGTPEERVSQRLSSTFTYLEPSEPDESPLDAVELYVVKDFSVSDDDVHGVHEETSFEILLPCKPTALSSTFSIEDTASTDRACEVRDGSQHDAAKQTLIGDTVIVEMVADEGGEDVFNSFLIDSLEGERFSDVDMAVDFFEFESVPLSPVVDAENGDQRPLTEVPVSATIRRTRLYSLMSTPNKEAAGYSELPGTSNESVAGVSVEWLETSSQNNSHGYGGSEPASLAASSSQAAKTSDSAIFLNEDTSLDNCPTLASIVENRKRHRCSHQHQLLLPIAHDDCVDPCQCQDEGELAKHKGFIDELLARVMDACPPILHHVPSSAKTSVAAE